MDAAAIIIGEDAMMMMPWIGERCTTTTCVRQSPPPPHLLFALSIFTRYSRTPIVRSRALVVTDWHWQWHTRELRCTAERSLSTQKQKCYLYWMKKYKVIKSLYAQNGGHFSDKSNEWALKLHVYNQRVATNLAIISSETKKMGQIDQTRHQVVIKSEAVRWREKLGQKMW